MPKQVALICTIEKIPGYADSTSDLYALNVSTGLQPLAAGETFDPALTGVVDLLQPWKWTAPGAGGSFAVDVWCQTDPSDITKGKHVSGTCLAPPALLNAPQPIDGSAPVPNPREAAAASLLAELQGAAAAIATGDLVIFDNADPGKLNSSVKDASGRVRQHWPHLLSHASTFPPPVPQALNLVMFFRLPTDATVRKIYVAPNFVVNGFTYTCASTAPAAAPSPVGSPTIGAGTRWAYPVTGAQVPVTVFQPGLDLSEPAPETWIQGTSEDGNQDWRTNLDQLLPDSFDLAQRALDAWRALTSTDISNIFGVPPNSSASAVTDPTTLEILRKALLSVLRDTADFGLRLAPDNSSLVRFVLSRIGQTDSQIVAIESALKVADAALSFQSWNTTLLGIFPGSLVLQPVASWPSARCSLEILIALLEPLQTQLATDTTLAQCLYAGWNSVALPNWSAIKGAVQTELQTLATSHTLRKRMLQANVGGADTQLATWKAIVNIPAGVTDEVVQLRTNLTNLLPAFFASRFGFTQPPGAPALADARQPVVSGTGLPKWQALLAVMSTNIASQAANFGSEIFPAGPQPAKEPQPLIIKVQPGAQPDNEADDPLRAMSGVGVLLLEDNQTDWSALNMASIYVNTAQTAAPSATAPVTPVWVKAAANVLAPYRIHIRNGIRQAAISYDNEPLIARSPLADMAAEVPVQMAPFATQANPLFQYRYEPDPVALLDNTKLDAWARIYGLKFGHCYSLLPFRMFNSGALPVELTDGRNPLALQPPNQFPFKPAPPNPASPILGTPPPVTHACYMRRVAVAHPRIVSPDGSDQKLVLPEIPATVFPLARIRDKSAAAAPSPMLDSAGNPLPLLLLWNKGNKPTVNSSFSFNVRPPLINFETWDRWVAAQPDPRPDPSSPTTPTLRKTRAAVNADKVRASRKNEDVVIPATASIDPSINDPAISHLEFRLTAISTGETTAPASLYLAVPFPQPLPLPLNPLDGFRQVQSAPCVVTISIGAIGFTLDPTPAAPKLTLNVPRGEVWKLSITPVVSKDALARFEKFSLPIVDQFDPNPITPAPAFDRVNPYYRVIAAARDLLVETAAPLVDKPDAVWKSLQLAFDPATRTLTASLAPGALARPDLFYGLDITHQAWRWMGRPFTETSFPCELGTGTATGDDLNSTALLTKALAWEAEAFAERSLTNTHTESSNVNYPVLRNSAQDSLNNITTVLRSYATQSLTSRDLSNDLRAQYFLFAIEAHSRYEGLPLFDDGQSIAASETIPSDTPASTPWRRVFVRASATPAPPPKPKILLCIPLPEPLDPTTSSVTSLLAIADEPWPQVGGLAEQLRAAIQLTRDPSLPLDQASDPARPPLPEIGPDPILFPTSSLAPSQTPIVSFDGLGAPIGTTFDDLSAAPLFANTCFEFSLPSFVRDPVVKIPLPVDWYQARITFTRELDSCLTEQPRGSQLVSLPSDPFLVQFLPSSYHFRYKILPAGDPLPTPLNVRDPNFSFSVDAGNIQFQFGQPVTPMAGPAGVTPPAEHLELWALVMHQITDAAGKPGQTYGGIYRADATGDFVPLATTGLPPAAVAKSSDSIYLLEVQTDSKQPHASLVIESALFSVPNALAEVTHRIVRMSPRIANPTPA